MDGDEDGKPDAYEAVHNNDLAEASSYVDSVMSQPICAVMRTPIGSRRKRFLSAQRPIAQLKKRKDSSPKSSSSKDSEDLSSASGSYYRSDDSSDDDFDLDAEELASDSGSKGLRRIVRAKRDRKGEKTKPQRNATRETEADVHGQKSDISLTLNALSILEGKIDKMNDRFDEIKQSNNDTINKLREEIKSVRNEFSNRLDGFTKKVETRVTETLQKTIDSKVKAVQKDMKKEMSKEISKLSEILLRDVEHSSTKVSTLDTNLQQLQETVGDVLDQSSARPRVLEDRARNIVIRNLQDSEGENTLNKVNALIKDGLKLREAVCIHAERKQSQVETQCGVIIATCDTNESKREIMRAKSNLRNSRAYERVFIEHDMPVQERNQIANLRRLVSAVGKDSLRMRGSKVVFNEYNGQYNDTGHYNGRERNRSYNNDSSSARENYWSDRDSNNPSRGEHRSDRDSYQTRSNRDSRSDRDTYSRSAGDNRYDREGFSQSEGDQHSRQPRNYESSGRDTRGQSRRDQHGPSERNPTYARNLRQ